MDSSVTAPSSLLDSSKWTMKMKGKQRHQTHNRVSALSLSLCLNNGLNFIYFYFLRLGELQESGPLLWKTIQEIIQSIYKDVLIQNLLSFSNQKRKRKKKKKKKESILTRLYLIPRTLTTLTFENPGMFWCAALLGFCQRVEKGSPPLENI